MPDNPAAARAHAKHLKDLLFIARAYAQEGKEIPGDLWQKIDETTDEMISELKEDRRRR